MVKRHGKNIWAKSKVRFFLYNQGRVTQGAGNYFIFPGMRKEIPSFISSCFHHACDCFAHFARGKLEKKKLGTRKGEEGDRGASFHPCYFRQYILPFPHILCMAEKEEDTTFFSRLRFGQSGKTASVGHKKQKICNSGAHSLTFVCLIKLCFWQLCRECVNPLKMQNN